MLPNLFFALCGKRRIKIANPVILFYNKEKTVG